MDALLNQFMPCRVLLLAGALLVGASVGNGAESLSHPHDVMGRMSCTAVSCHGGGGPGYWSGSAKGAEYVHWLGTNPTYGGGRRDYDPRARLVKVDGDPHAVAAQRMREPRFQEVLRRASGRTDGSIDSAMLLKCAKCHDPGSQIAANELDKNASAMQGIGCETCHGGAGQWLAVHYQNGVTRDELSRLGMIDTKNLHVRAKLCASCHVGSAENDMNHDMIAAGHPPLRFEQASYEALLGRKHWDDAPARAANPNYEVQLWAAGRIAAAMAAVELLEGRSQRSEVGGHKSEGSGAKPWPELAESNCLACHQPLRRDGSPKVELGLLKSRITIAPWQTWNTTLTEIALPDSEHSINELPRPDGDWHASLLRLRAAMDQSALPDAQQVTKLAGQTKLALQQRVDRDPLSVTALSVLEAFGEIEATANWDELCQRVAALAAVRRSLQDQGKLSGPMADLAKQRIERLATTLRFTNASREWPVLFTDHSPLSRAEVAHELSRLKADLLREARQ